MTQGLDSEDGSSIKDAVLRFGQYLGACAEYSLQTARAYSADLMQFVEYVEEAFGRPLPGDITPAVIQQYRESIAALKPATVSRKLSALSTFFNWLWLRGEVEANPVAAVKRPRRKPEDTKWVTAEDAVALLAACRDDRERAIFATYMRAALRYSELMKLRLGDLDLLRGEMYVTGKGGSRRAVPVLADLRPYLVRWLAVRPNAGHDYLFTTRTGAPLYEKACWRLFRGLLRRAGLEHKGYTVHSLRHGAATQMHEAGVDLATIARFLRHADLSTVGRYVHASTESVRREVEAKMGRVLPDGGGVSFPAEAVRMMVAEVLHDLLLILGAEQARSAR